MDEKAKAEKLAAARLKLKKHQQRKLKQNEIRTTNIESVDYVQNTPSMPQIQSYFNTESVSDVSNFLNIPATIREADAITPEDPEINANEILKYAKDSNNKQHISTTEQLQQLSDQITHIVGDSNGIGHYNNHSDLENRNIELAALLEAEKLKIAQQTAETEIHKSRISQLERELELSRVDHEHNVRQQVDAMDNEMKNLRQTCSLLVGEKNELSASLNHIQMLQMQKTNECDELQARLKTSRSRVADLEREVIGLREEHSIITNTNKEHQKTQCELQKLQLHQSEIEQDLSEMQERLKKTQDENNNLQKKYNESEKKLSLADVKIQQLTHGINSNEQFMHEKHALEQKISELNTLLQSAIADREQSGLQYQQFVQQLNANIATLTHNLETSTKQIESQAKREQELVMHINELEKHLQTENTTNNETNSSNIQQQLSELNALQNSHTELKNRFDLIKSERDDFIKDAEEKKLAIEELQSVIERLRNNQSNNSQLMAEIESDKVAASRAVDQNLKLKQQLEEMQDAFIRMTNDKAELITQLSSEQFRRKEVEEMQMQLSQQLQTLTDAIEIKDRELTEMRINSESLNRHSLQQDQLADRLRHYEAHENNVHALGRELQTAREEIEKMHLQQHELLAQIAEFNTSEKEPIKDTELQSVEDKDKSGENVSLKEVAMKQLETKFTRTMQEVANLQDEKQLLEHIVMQLQGETDTIGEYITLYQHQRGVLKQRATEREAQMKQLSSDREHMKTQLNRLNDLIKRLLMENKVPEDVLQEQEVLNENALVLCKEHAHVQSEDRAEGEGNTAQKIMTLLGEINTSNLVQPNDISDSFRPCPLCSGRLMTV